MIKITDKMIKRVSSHNYQSNGSSSRGIDIFSDIVMVLFGILAVFILGVGVWFATSDVNPFMGESYKTEYATVQIDKNIEFDNSLYDEVLHKYNTTKKENETDFLLARTKLLGGSHDRTYNDISFYFKNKKYYTVDEVKIDSKVDKPVIKLKYKTKYVDDKPTDYQKIDTITLLLPKL